MFLVIGRVGKEMGIIGVKGRVYRMEGVWELLVFGVEKVL